MCKALFKAARATLVAGFGGRGNCSCSLHFPGQPYKFSLTKQRFKKANVSVQLEEKMGRDDDFLKCIQRRTEFQVKNVNISTSSNRSSNWYLVAQKQV